jgi:hypothetical protein
MSSVEESTVGNLGDPRTLQAGDAAEQAVVHRLSV